MLDDGADVLVVVVRPLHRYFLVLSGFGLLITAGGDFSQSERGNEGLPGFLCVIRCKKVILLGVGSVVLHVLFQIDFAVRDDINQNLFDSLLAHGPHWDARVLNEVGSQRVRLCILMESLIAVRRRVKLVG